MPPQSVGTGLLAEVSPPWPFRIPARGGPDLVSRSRAGVFERFLHIGGAPILARAWQPADPGPVRISAMPVEPAWLSRAEGVRRRRTEDYRRRRGWRERTPRPARDGRRPSPATEPFDRASEDQLEEAIERVRNALGVDDDYSDFYARFKRDPLLGPAIRRRPWLRVRRAALPWEALCWAITEQLIEVERAHQIQRRIIARWGLAALPPDRDRALGDVPGPGVIGARAPAELAALDLAPKRAAALIRVAREVASGRIDLDRPESVQRLLAVSEIGPWTVQVLGHKGRGDPDSLPAGDLAYLKLVPRLIGMDRRATVEEVEEFYAPYAPYRGWAGLFTLVAHGSKAAPPLKYHPPREELEAA